MTAIHRRRRPSDTSPPALPTTRPPRPRPTVTIGARLRFWRKHYGLTTDQLADFTGYSIASLEDFERNARDPTLHMLRALAELYGISLSELLQDVE
jgi:DNA-binding XRE family transcriptional regulator